jgi:hypothetical protein
VKKNKKTDRGERDARREQGKIMADALQALVDALAERRVGVATYRADEVARENIRSVVTVTR